MAGKAIPPVGWGDDATAQANGAAATATVATATADDQAPSSVKSRVLALENTVAKLLDFLERHGIRLPA